MCSTSPPVTERRKVAVTTNSRRSPTFGGTAFNHASPFVAHDVLAPVRMLRERPTDLHRYHAHECTPSLSVSFSSVLGLQAMTVTTASRTLRVSAGLSVSQAQALKSLKLQLLQDTRQCRFGPDRRNARCSRVPSPLMKHKP